MSLIPIEVVDSILEYNNIKLVFNKKTMSFHTKFLDYGSYEPVSNIYKQLVKRGTSKIVVNINKTVDTPWNEMIWHELSLPNKWFIRDYTLNYAENDHITECYYLAYVNYKSYYSTNITYNKDKSVILKKTVNSK